MTKRKAPARHIDRTNSATLRRYRLMGVAAALRRVSQKVRRTVDSLVAPQRVSVPVFDAHPFEEIVSGYLMSNREMRAWTHFLREGFNKGVRATFDERDRSPYLVLSAAGLVPNSYRQGRRDEFVRTVAMTLDIPLLVTDTASRLRTLCRALSVRLFDTVRDADRLGLSPVEIDRRVRTVLVAALESAQSFIHDEVTRAYEEGRRRARDRSWR